MLKKFVVFGLLMVFLSTATLAMAEDVYVTERGKKYHKETCRLIKNKDSMIKMSKDEAVAAGYLPCKRCYREDITKDAKTTTDDQAKKEAKQEKNQQLIKK